MRYLLLIIIFYLLLICNNNIIENFKWIKRSDCKYQTNKTILYVLNKYGIDKGDLVDWDLYLPCTYNNINLELQYIPASKLGKNLFIINNCDSITSKNNLWRIIYLKYGLREAIKIMPETYILNNKNELNRLVKNHKQNKLYILKKNIQRQQGLKITNNINDILNGKNNGYVIAQDLLQNPYLINNRKINLRIYLLIVCKNNKIEAYAHKNGFVYYTADKFIKNSLDFGPNVTTGYIDRQIYIDNPLTLEDFIIYFDKKEIINNNRKPSTILFNKIYTILNKIIEASSNSICSSYNIPSYISKQTSFQLFGADFSVSDELEPQIMEINKGPDLGAKDKRDKQVKISVATDMLTTIGLIKEKTNNFIKIY